MSNDQKPIHDTAKAENPTNRYANPHGKTAWSRGGATTAFRAINPELFIKPNKFTTIVGLLTLSGCVAFMGYLHAMDENQKDLLDGSAYKAVDEEGNYAKVVSRKSRWD